MSPAQPALYPVFFNGHLGLFNVGNMTLLEGNSPTELTQRTMLALGDLIQQSQSLFLNLFAESVLTFGVKNFGLNVTERDEQYPTLYSKMVQGVLEYHVCSAHP